MAVPEPQQKLLEDLRIWFTVNAREEHVRYLGKLGIPGVEDHEGSEAVTR
jgi:hypothetical protein